MKPETENAIRSIISTDPEIGKGDVDRAMAILRGTAATEEDMIHVVKRKDAMDILKVHRRTLDYYLKKGYLKRVYGGGRRKSLGITRESLIEFMRMGLDRPRDFTPAAGVAEKHRNARKWRFDK